MPHLYNIISDDDSFSEKLVGLLNKIGNYKLNDQSKTLDSAVESILKEPPHLVFVDFENSEIENHFDFIHELNLYLENLPHFIGVASTTTFAYKAIKNNFSEYLLKSSTSLDVRKMLMKMNKRRIPPQICVSSYSDHHYINLSDIIYLKADNSTTDFFLKNDVKITAYKTLKHYERILPKDFLRIHHSYIINTNKVFRINFAKRKIFLNTNKHFDVPFSKSNTQVIKDLHDALISTSFKI